jgi:hypothetical protein
MKFYRTKGLPATTWNPQTDRARYHFTDGVFETEDPDLIKFMQDLGYQSEPVPTRNQPVEEPGQREEVPVIKSGRPKKG